MWDANFMEQQPDGTLCRNFARGVPTIISARILIAGQILVWLMVAGCQANSPKSSPESRIGLVRAPSSPQINVVSPHGNKPQLPTLEAGGLIPAKIVPEASGGFRLDGGHDVVIKGPAKLSGVAMGKNLKILGWEQVSGPGQLTFDNPQALDPVVAADQEGSYTITLSAQEAAGSLKTATVHLLWDVTPPPPLANFSAHQASGIHGGIRLALLFPQPVDDYQRVDIRRVLGAQSPNDCSQGQVIATITDFYDHKFIDKASPGFSYSYRVCIYDRAGNETSAMIAENLKAYRSNGGPGCLTPPCDLPRGLGGGAFRARSDIAVPTGSIKSSAVGDLDGDGHLDYLLGKSSGNHIFYGDGQGNFPTRVDLSAPFINTRWLALGDIDSDGDLDIVETNGSKLVAYTNDGTGGFTESHNATVGTNIRHFSLGDVDNDGALDVALAQEDAENLIILGNGNGTFQSAANLSSDKKKSQHLALGDINLDGNLDAVIANGQINIASQEIRLHYGNGDGTFAPGIDVSTAAQYKHLRIGDLNNDGLWDIVSASWGGREIELFTGNGPGFDDGLQINFSSQTYGLAAADFDGNGVLDISVNKYSVGDYALFRFDNGLGFEQVYEAQDNFQISGEFHQQIVADINEDGTIDILSFADQNKFVVYLGNDLPEFSFLHEAQSTVLGGDLLLKFISKDKNDLPIVDLFQKSTDDLGCNGNPLANGWSVLASNVDSLAAEYSWKNLQSVGTSYVCARAQDASAKAYDTTTVYVMPSEVSLWISRGLGQETDGAHLKSWREQITVSEFQQDILSAQPLLTGESLVQFRTGDSLAFADLPEAFNGNQLSMILAINPSQDNQDLAPILTLTGASRQIALTMGGEGKGSSRGLALSIGQQAVSGIYRDDLFNEDTMQIFSLVYDGEQSVEGERLKLYREGTEISDIASFGVIPDNLGQTMKAITLGHRDEISYKGLLGDLLVVTRSLSPSEITEVSAHLRATYTRRVRAGLLHLYTFAESSGSRVFDRSQSGNPLDLDIANPANVSWLSNGGLAIDSPTIIKSSGPANRLTAQCKSDNELTVEAWIKPQNLSQNGPARIVTLSQDTSSARNFTMGQEGDAYIFRSNHTPSGYTEFVEPLNAVTMNLQHVVMTHDGADGVRSIFVDSLKVGTELVGGDFAGWGFFDFALGNETTENRPWLGEIHLVAVYCRALSEAEITRNFKVGPQGG